MLWAVAALLLVVAVAAGVAIIRLRSATTAGAPPQAEGNRVVIAIGGGSAVVDTATLGVTAAGIELSAAADGLGPVDGPRVSGDVARWSYPQRALTVTARAEQGRLRMDVRSERAQRLRWPVTGGDPGTVSLQVPRGEGLSLPVGDPFWNSPAAGLVGDPVAMTSRLTMPLWGYRIGGRGVSYLVPTDIGSSLAVSSDRGRLRAAGEHEFGSGADDYTVTFALTDTSPVAAARDYRDWLITHDRFRALAEKIRDNPSISLLRGAFHAYLFGDGRTPDAVRRLRELGVSRMWLGYDSDDRPMSTAAVSAAKQAGYLAGPYDSYANAQDPATADNPSSRWPDGVWPGGCVRRADGSPQPGFHDRGCYLSSQVLAQRPQLYRDRYAAMTANGADTYFLDVDAAGEFFDDHSPDHPMNQAQDRRNRLDRMRWLGEHGTVLGSESAGAWAAPVLAFDHGSQTPVSDALWTVQRDRQVWGGWAPQGAPKSFFQPATLPDAVARAMFDPAYRIPLLETALHDSKISADRWELPYYKLPGQQTMRALTAMLNQTPMNFVLDDDAIAEHGPEIARLQQYFAPLHETAATLPMTGFDWLTDDHLVQRTVFGDHALTVTANFGSRAHGELPAGCVDARLSGDKTPRRLCLG
ncbi:glycosyl hydrolase family 101 [Nocardia pseudobrasiliensis]|uniref:Glycosyl hydrolase family 101 n=2 Tax=Nocardia pseudobrasiliensis TaxID=45979 RepID=A0A370IDU9_9NOCA|nr:glycosyl hydrolase family 101 [Nocardia pseudobrasiliensis]